LTGRFFADRKIGKCVGAYVDTS